MALNFNSSCFYSIRHINSGKFLYELVVNDTHLAAFGNVTEAGEAGLFQFSEIGLEIITVKGKKSQLFLTHLNAYEFDITKYDTGIVHNAGFAEVELAFNGITVTQSFYLFVATYVSYTDIISVINGYGYNLIFNENSSAYITDINSKQLKYTPAVFDTSPTETEARFDVTEQCSCPTNGSECFPSTTPFRIVQLSHFHNDDYSDAADFGLLGVLSLTGMLMLWH